MKEETIRCSRCGEWLLPEAFHKDETKPHRFGRSSTCKECLRQKRQARKVAYVYEDTFKRLDETYTYVGFTTDPNRPEGHFNQLSSDRKTHPDEFQRMFNNCRNANRSKSREDWFNANIDDFTDELKHLSDEDREKKLKEYESTQMDIVCDKYIRIGLNPRTYVMNKKYSDTLKPIDYEGTGCTWLHGLLEFEEDQRQEMREYLMY